MKNIIKIIGLTLMISSCGDFEPVVYDNVNGQTLAFFDRTTSNLEVLIDDVGSVDIKIGVSTLSSTARTVNVSVVTESTTADASNYTVPSSVTIPANEFFGILTINGVDNTLETSAKIITLQIDSVDGGIASSKQHSVSIYQICTVPESFFTGTYLIEQQSGSAPFGIGSAWGTQTVEIVASGLTRSFDYIWGVGSFDSPYFMDMTLVCNQIFVYGTIQPGNGTLGCGDGSIGQSTASTPGTYDVTDDSVIFVNVLDFEPDSGCGTNYEAVLKFTKQ